jgi:hypothetical protein
MKALEQLVSGDGRTKFGAPARAAKKSRMIVKSACAHIFILKVMAQNEKAINNLLTIEIPLKHSALFS